MFREVERMKTAKQYIDSIRDMNHEIYLFGQRVKSPVDHPIIRPTVNCVAATYELAHKPNYESLLTATSHLTGRATPVNPASVMS